MDIGHGRIDERHTRVFALEPLECGLPQVRTLVSVRKRSTPTRREAAVAAGAGEETLSFYVSSRPPGAAEPFAALVRGHWGGCESRNHWVRDALFEEDATLSKNLNLNGNLAVLRCALIALKDRLAPGVPWPAVFEMASMRTSTPYNMVFKNTFK